LFIGLLVLNFFKPFKKSVVGDSFPQLLSACFNDIECAERLISSEHHRFRNISRKRAIDLAFERLYNERN